ncbi:hypothetical protein SEPCBS119000_002480 [Sporothrix epigloea]|uniref:CCHC-type domain-containing protein n=1 Tax=Sporothrix epigloea TaxID=1892477 RepID=A0ABP0DJ50_9PEZI
MSSKPVTRHDTAAAAAAAQATPTTPAAQTTESDDDSQASESHPSITKMFRQLQTDFARLHANTEQGFARTNAAIEKLREANDATNERLEALEIRSRGPSSPVIQPAKEKPAKAAAKLDMSLSGSTPLTSQADEAPKFTYSKQGIEEIEIIHRHTAEFEYFEKWPYTPASSTRPSEGFVKALFPPLATQEFALSRETPPQLTNSKLKLPTFEGDNDPILHHKLLRLQKQLHESHVNLADWPSFSSSACGESHEHIANWAHDRSCKWHHFVFALICANGLSEYHHQRDAAFVQFKIVQNSKAPEEIMVDIQRELRFAPGTHKATAQRAQEFRELMLRLDAGLVGHIPPFVPNNSRATLIEWVYNVASVSKRHWTSTRASNSSTATVPATTPSSLPVVTTAPRPSSDVVVDIADAYNLSEIMVVEMKRGRCYNCGEKGHYSPQCRAPKSLKAPPQRSERRRQTSGGKHVTSSLPKRASQNSKAPTPIVNKTVKIAKGTIFRAHEDGDFSVDSDHHGDDDSSEDGSSNDEEVINNIEDNANSHHVDALYDVQEPR